MLTKGADWGPSEIVGRAEVEAAGGKVVSLSLEPGYSTTAILQKILTTTPGKSEARIPLMLSPAVTERLARVARHPAVDESLDRLRHGSMLETVAGLTDPCKALVVAIAASELRRPILWVVDTERRAEALLEPLRFFRQRARRCGSIRRLASRARRTPRPRSGAAPGNPGDARRHAVALRQRTSVGHRHAGGGHAN